MPLDEMLHEPIQRKEGWRWSCINKYHFLQILVALGGSLTALAPGMSMGFSAVALPQLRPLEGSTASPAAISQSVAFNSSSRDAARLTLANDDAAWFTTMTMASTPVGCIIAGFLNDKWGRKRAMLAVAFPGIVGWLLVALVPANALATSGVFLQLMVGRALSGIALGMSSSPACILAGETSAPSIRGSVLCLNSLSICGGILLAYFLGAALPGWRSVAAFGAILTGLVALVTLSLPESPVWLRNQGRFGDAEWVCAQLGLRAVDSGIPTRKEEEARKNKTIEISQDLRRVLRLLLEPRSLRPFLLLLGVFAFQQAAGVFVVAFNAVEIASSSGLGGRSFVDGNLTAVLLGICSFIVVTIVCVFIDRWGRRKALIISGLGMAMCMFGLAAYIHFCMPKMYAELISRFHQEIVYNHTSLLEHYLHLSSAGDIPAEDSPWHTFVPLVTLLFWSGFGALGFVPIPWALPPELLPSETRGVASGIVSAMAYAFAFAALMTFSSAILVYPLPICLLVMGIFALCGTIYVAALLPETRGVAIDGILEKGSNWKELRGRPGAVNYKTDTSTLI